MSSATDAVLRPLGRLGAVLGATSRRRLFAGSGVLYGLLYLWTIQDISPGGRGFQLRTTRWERMFERMGPVTFEPVAQLTVPGLTILVSPLDILVAALLGALVALGVTLTALAWRRPEACDVSPILVGVPTLLAGLACLVPGATIVLRIPVPSSFVPVLQALIPVTLVSLVAAAALALRRTEPERLEGGG